MAADTQIQQAQNEVRKWSRQTATGLRRQARQFRKGKLVRSIVKNVNINGRPSFKATEEKLRYSVRSRVYARSGEYPDRIRFNYAYHGFFLEKGIGPGRRTATPWLSTVMGQQVSKLGDGTAKRLADAAVKAIF